MESKTRRLGHPKPYTVCHKDVHEQFYTRINCETRQIKRADAEKKVPVMELSGIEKEKANKMMGISIG